MRIAVFTEVYWPMVSGVSLTVQRAVDGLRARGHAVRVYAATYELPPGATDGPASTGASAESRSWDVIHDGLAAEYERAARSIRAAA
ncbi:MAG TPA: hypothetical protein VFM14_01105 [Gemmatimonadales bacterium]|nr:hypothetical protein [Gemmatimonadales bacterium]